MKSQLSTLMSRMNNTGLIMKNIGLGYCVRNNYKGLLQTQLWLTSTSPQYCSNDSEYGRQLGGYEYKEGINSFRSLWRKPILEQKGFWKSSLDVFSSKKFSGFMFRLNPDNFKYFSLRRLRNKTTVEQLKIHQRFIEDRLNILGCELAAAHFVVFRGGAVKFHGHSDWIRDDKKNNDYDDNLPNSFRSEYVLEAIDLSGTQILYEGLKNMENLKDLKWLSVALNPFCDNWYFDRLSGEFGENLEYLDVSYTNISATALTALYRFKQLKTLKLYGFAETPGFVNIVEELKVAYPDLTIEGVVPKLSSNDSLVEDLDSEYIRQMSKKNLQY